MPAWLWAVLLGLFLLAYAIAIVKYQAKARVEEARAWKEVREEALRKEEEERQRKSEWRAKERQLLIKEIVDEIERRRLRI